MYYFYHKKRIIFILFSLLFCTLLSTRVLYADLIASYTLQNQAICSNNKLIVISSGQIPVLLGADIEHVSLFKQSADRWQQLLFQVDQKDSQGRYLLKKNFPKERENHYFSNKDELVFRAKDLGDQLKMTSAVLNNHSLIELKIITDNKEVIGWLYIELNSKDRNLRIRKNNLLIYDAEQDSIHSSIYKIGFSKKHPFLLEQFHWRLDKSNAWSPDLADTMKIRHKGNFLGLPFQRTQDDYISELTAVKKGSLRIIRRTKNHLKVLWQLKTPALYIDYVITEYGFVMDSMIDIPFDLSYFFSNLSTITTMDWNQASPPQNFIIQATKQYPEISINGIPSDDKRKFNLITGHYFSLSDTMGHVNVMLDIPEDFPIQSKLYLRDDVNEVDLPENDLGQYGNIGFNTTGWERIASKLYHLKFTVCVATKSLYY